MANAKLIKQDDGSRLWCTALDQWKITKKEAHPLPSSTSTFHRATGDAEHRAAVHVCRVLHQALMTYENEYVENVPGGNG